MKGLINVLRWICAILLSIGLIVFGMVQIISSTIFNKDYVIGKLDSTNYYVNTYSQVNSDFENYILQSGLDKSVLEDLVTVEDITKDTKLIISNIYDGRNGEIDATHIKEKLTNNIEKSLEDKDIDSSTQKAIDKFIETIVEQYKDSILHTDAENNIFDAIYNAKKLIGKATTISISIMGVTAIFIIASRYKKFWQNITIMGVPLVSTGVFYIFTYIFLNNNVDIKNIRFMSEAMSYSLRQIIFGMLGKFMAVGIIMIIAGTASIIIGSMIRTRKHKHSRSH